MCVFLVLFGLVSQLHWESSYHAPRHGQASHNTLKNKAQVWVTLAPCVALTVTLYPVLSPLWAPDQLSLLRRTQREQAEKDFVV